MRLVKFTKKSPEKIEGKEKTIFICQCGLSKKFPYCDGHHKLTKDEEDESLYVYEEDKRVKI